MIYDPKVGALYGDDGKFIKTVSCPLALHPDQLQIVNGVERFCCACNKSIYNIDNMSDIEVKKIVKEDEKICVFATPNAKNITILEKSGAIYSNTNNYQVIQTLRSLESMDLAQKNGFLILIKDVGIPQTFGEDKFKIHKKKETGELWWTCDYRDSLLDKEIEDNIFEDEEIDPDTYMKEKWETIRNWFYARRDQPFPLAAYAIPNDLTVGTRVFLSDVIEDVKYVYWNQGNAQRILSIAATWNGQDFEIDQPEPPQFVG